MECFLPVKIIKPLRGLFPTFFTGTSGKHESVECLLYGTAVLDGVEADRDPGCSRGDELTYIQARSLRYGKLKFLASTVASELLT